MRIIGGSLGGRRIKPPADMPHTRPTTDIAREGLFNILHNGYAIEGAVTLDLFGGTGCISYELASRGASSLTIVEKDPRMCGFIERTTTQLGITNLRLVRSEVFRFLATCADRFDIVFAGPPYALSDIERLPEEVFGRDILNEEGCFILEHTPRNDFKTHPRFQKERRYGTTVFSIFAKEE
jgi:16S rRNA (guanine(966)-N(2))-methyltransferase RsmD